MQRLHSLLSVSGHLLGWFAGRGGGHQRHGEEGKGEGAAGEVHGAGLTASQSMACASLRLQAFHSRWFVQQGRISLQTDKTSGPAVL